MNPSPSALQIWFDPVCPWCFIGLAKLKQAQAAVGGEVLAEWRPFQLSPDVPQEGVVRATYFAQKFGGHEHATAAWARVAAAGAAEGVRFDFSGIRLEPNTLDAHRSVRFAQARDRATDFVKALFGAHFQRGLFIGDREVLAGLADEVGLDGRALRTHLTSDADLVETRAEVQRSRVIGVRSVPSYGLNGHLLSAAETADFEGLIRRVVNAR